MTLINQALHLYQKVRVNLKESKSKWLDTRRNLARLHTVTSPLPTVHWKINVPITTFDDYEDVIYSV